MPEIKKIVALGAGRMGRGIAQVFAYAGYTVQMLDIKQRDADDFSRLKSDARGEIRKNLKFLAKQNIISNDQIEKILDLISVCPREECREILGAADIVLEGVPEIMEAKIAALKLLDEHTRKDIPIASTTSTMSVSELQNMLGSPQRFLNTHFLNPAYLIPLVEVSPGPLTDEKVVQDVIILFKKIGKQPVRCAARPGYIIPRLQSLIMAEACRMLEEGVVTAEDLDRAIKYGFGPRYASMGIVEFMDWGGLDTVYYAGNQLADALDSPAHRAPPLIKEMLDKGQGGMRDGKGFYDFRNFNAEQWQEEKLSRFIKLLGQLDQIPEPGI